jgi:hypothetical protein
MRTSYLLSATATAMLVGATAASAGTITIKDVEVDPNAPYNLVNITGDVPGQGSFTKDGQISGLILLTTSTGQTLPVFCVDLFHDVGIGGGQSLIYQADPVTTDSTGADSGTGNTLTSPPVPGEIQTLVNIGYSGYVHNNLDGDHLTALQDAIWDIEYNDTGTLSVDGGTAINTLASEYITYAEDHPADYSEGLYGSISQGFGTSQGFVVGAPEPSTYAMMVLGFAGLGFAGLRKARAKPAFA